MSFFHGRLDAGEESNNDKALVKWRPRQDRVSFGAPRQFLTLGEGTRRADTGADSPPTNKSSSSQHRLLRSHTRDNVSTNSSPHLKSEQYGSSFASSSRGARTYSRKAKHAPSPDTYTSDSHFYPRNRERAHDFFSQPLPEQPQVGTDRFGDFCAQPGAQPGAEQASQSPDRFRDFFDISADPTYGGPTLHTQQPRAPHRDRPVEVWTLRPERYNNHQGSTFHCNREDLLYHFPRLRLEPFGRKLCVIDHIRPDLWRPDTPVVLTHIFRGLENYRISGAPVDIFGRADDMLERGSDSRRSFHDVAMFFCGVCGVLAKEGGLGCSEEILGQVDEFVVGLLEMSEPDAAFPDMMCRNVVVSYSKVFQPTTVGHMETLRQVWSMMPVEMKVRISTELVHITRGAAAGGSSPQVFFGALRELSLL